MVDMGIVTEEGMDMHKGKVKIRRFKFMRRMIKSR
jgi:hypothetical protein